MAEKIAFWKRVESRLSEVGLTHQQLWEKISVSEGTGFGWIKNSRIPNGEFCYKITKVLDTSLRYLVTGEETSLPDDEYVKNGIDIEFRNEAGKVIGEDGEESIFVPLVRQRVSAGPGQEFLPASAFCGNVCILKRMTRGIDPGSLIAARVRGDSMTGIQLNDGDIVVFTRTITDAGEGIYVISLYGEVRVKRIAFQPSRHQVIILSENPKYSPEEIDEKNENLRILGKVIGWIHCQPY